jgi:hypothetical protein
MIIDTKRNWSGAAFRLVRRRSPTQHHQASNSEKHEESDKYSRENFHVVRLTSSKSLRQAQISVSMAPLLRLANATVCRLFSLKGCDDFVKPYAASERFPHEIQSELTVTQMSRNTEALQKFLQGEIFSPLYV